MSKFEVIVREVRVLKYKIEAPSEQIVVDRVITDYVENPLPYQTTRLSREIYTAAIEEVNPVENTSYHRTPCFPTAPSEKIQSNPNKGRVRKKS